MSNKQKSFSLGGAFAALYRLVFHCPRGKHSRSLDHVAPEGDRYVSQCVGCGTRMIRLSKRNWIVDPDR